MKQTKPIYQTKLPEQTRGPAGCLFLAIRSVASTPIDLALLHRYLRLERREEAFASDGDCVVGQVAGDPGTVSEVSGEGRGVSHRTLGSVGQMEGGVQDLLPIGTWTHLGVAQQHLYVQVQKVK